MRAVPKLKRVTMTGAFLAVAVAISLGTAVARDPNAKEAATEMEWGFKAARRGYWQEALMRFSNANELTPGQSRILNNIAVAQEANGLYEMALLTYQEGLALDPGNNALQRNYKRFQEFYTTYIAIPEVEGNEGEAEKGAEDEEENR